MKNKFPKTINLTITEETRLKAEGFCSNGNCLIATAVKAKGFKDVREGVSYTLIGAVEYRHMTLGPEDLHKDSFATSKPFYLPSVVGLKIKLARVQ